MDETRVVNTRKNLRVVLEARFGALTSELVARLEAITDEGQLQGLLTEAARCPTLDEFRTRLVPGPD
jgi:hypothetical protein